MKPRYALVVFDWDGTLMDSTGLIVNCIQIAAREAELDVPSMEAANSIIGMGARDASRRLFPDITDEQQTAFALAYSNNFIARDHEAPLFEGVRELLEGLRHDARFLAVATGKSRAGLERAFQHTGIKPHFHYSRCADEGFPKPHPDMLIKLMDFTGVDAQQTLMIGDTTHDLELALNARVDAVAVTYGAHPRVELEKFPSKALLESVNSLQSWMTQNV